MPHSLHDFEVCFKRLVSMRKGHIWIEDHSYKHQGPFLRSGVPLRVTLTENKRQLLKPFLLQPTTKFGYVKGNSRHSYLHMSYVMCAYFKQWLLQDTPIQTLTKKPYSTKPQSSIFGKVVQCKQNKTETNKNNNDKKLAITVIEAKVPCQTTVGKVF